MSNAEIITRENSKSKTDFTVLTFVIVVGLALRIAYINTQTFYIDEAFNWLLGRQGLRDIMVGSASESNPPLPAIIAHYWLMAGNSVVWLRTLSVLFSLGALACGYALGRRLAGARGGVAVALMTAVSPHQLIYAHVFRYPAQAIFLGALGLLLFVKITLDGNRKLLWPFAGVCVLSLYTHYFFIFPVAFYNIYFLLIMHAGRPRDITSKGNEDSRGPGAFSKNKAHRRNTDAFRSAGVPPASENEKVRAIGVWPWLASQAAAAACFLPWFGFFASQGSKELAPVPAAQLAAHLKTFPIKGIFNVAQSFISGEYPAESKKWFLALALAAFALLAVAFVFARENRRERSLTAGAFALCLLAPYLMMIFLGLRLLPMYFCIFSPLFFVIVAQALCLKSPLWLRAAAGAALAVMLVFSLKFYFVNITPRADNATAINYILEHGLPGDVVVVNPTYQSSLFEYFAPGKLRLFGIPQKFDVLKYNFHNTTQVDAACLAQLDAEIPPGGRVWAFDGFGDVTKPDMNGLTVAFLMNRYKKAFEMRFSPAAFAGEPGRLYLFEKK